MERSEFFVVARRRVSCVLRRVGCGFALGAGNPFFELLDRHPMRNHALVEQPHVGLVEEHRRAVGKAFLFLVERVGDRLPQGERSILKRPNLKIVSS